MSERESFPQAIYGVTADLKATDDFSWIAESKGFTVDKQYLIKHEMFSGSYDVVRSNSNYSVGVILAYDPKNQHWCSVIVEEQISSKKDFRGRNPKITRFIQLPPQSDPVRYISRMSNQQLSMNESDRGNEAFEPYKFSKHLPQHIDTNDEPLINFAIQCLVEGKRLILKGGKPNNNINDDTPITWNSVYALGLVNQIISSKVMYDSLYDSLNIAIGYVNIERASLYDIIITFDDDERKWFSGKKALARNAEFIAVESFKPTGSYNNPLSLPSLVGKINEKKKEIIRALPPTTIVGDGSSNAGSNVPPFTTDVVESPKEDKKKLSGLPNKTKDGQLVQGGTSQPGYGGTSQPGYGGTSQPGGGGTSQPGGGGTSQPGGGGTSQPGGGGTSQPGGGNPANNTVNNNPQGARGRTNARKNGLNVLGNDSWIIGLVGILVVIAVIMMLVFALRSAVPATITPPPTLPSPTVIEALPATATETPTIIPTSLPSPTPDAALEQQAIAIQATLQAATQFIQLTQDTLAITAAASAMNATATVQTATQQAIVDQTATAASPAPIGYASVPACRNVRNSPSINSSIVGRIQSGVQFPVYTETGEQGKQQKWYRIHPTDEKWIADRLQEQATEADIGYYPEGNYNSSLLDDITIQQGSCSP